MFNIADTLSNLFRSLLVQVVVRSFEVHVLFSDLLILYLIILFSEVFSSDHGFAKYLIIIYHSFHVSILFLESFFFVLYIASEVRRKMAILSNMLPHLFSHLLAH